MAFISVTRLRIRSWWLLPQFIWAARRSSQQAERSPGNLKLALFRDARLTFWTLSAWESEAAMRAFMMSGIHRSIMPKLLDWCDEAAVAHWIQDSAELPDWKEAHRQLVSIGRLSKVRHPSREHTENRIAAPKA